MKEVLPGVKNRTLAILTAGTLAASAASFEISYQLTSNSPEAGTPSELCLEPVAGQMIQIKQESKDTETPICDEQPMQTPTITIPEMHTDIPPLAPAK